MANEIKPQGNLQFIEDLQGDNELYHDETGQLFKKNTASNNLSALPGEYDELQKSKWSGDYYAGETEAGPVERLMKGDSSIGPEALNIEDRVSLNEFGYTDEDLQLFLNEMNEQYPPGQIGSSSLSNDLLAMTVVFPFMRSMQLLRSSGVVKKGIDYLKTAWGIAKGHKAHKSGEKTQFEGIPAKDLEQIYSAIDGIKHHAKTKHLTRTPDGKLIFKIKPSVPKEFSRIEGYTPKPTKLPEPEIPTAFSRDINKFQDALEKFTSKPGVKVNPSLIRPNIPATAVKRPPNTLNELKGMPVVIPGSSKERDPSVEKGLIDSFQELDDIEKNLMSLGVRGKRK